MATQAEIIKSDALLFQNMPKNIEIGRYHSWAVNLEDFPSELEITAVDEEGMIMALQHKTYDVHAVQFHPESILTPLGRTILSNFLNAS